ncbi:MAG: ABC transporter permease subunit [Thermomicrobiales bacterium]
MRFIRAEFLKLRNQDFVQAAIAAGLPLRRVLFRHILPNAIAPLPVSASFGVAGAILAESTLSFLGLGLVDEASWGRLLDMARGEGGGFHWVDRDISGAGDLPDGAELQLHRRGALAMRWIRSCMGGGLEGVRGAEE